ncbi:glycine betaine ABC transporter substrate-binding protein [Pseudoclavibacter soli]|uniref:glycine betaine ABC transporter substrate-binding protein n=1 Tax=Pseudoclavibacter soli TaxID=452623 RepID=UPI00042A5C27
MSTPLFRIPLGDWVSAFIDWVTQTFGWLFSAIALVFGGLYNGLSWLFVSPPFWVVIAVLTALAWWVASWRLAVFAVFGLSLIYTLNQWENAMDTLALVIVASLIAVVIAVPLGILAAKSDTASKIIRPILDFMQTMPAFVYLIPAIILFSVGVVPGIFAAIIFALAPGVRLTELGIRGIDNELVEAGESFGASGWRILRQIQLPLALPSIMAGINQVIMLSLSMVVIAAMVGAAGLGAPVVQSLSRVDVSLGFEAGLSVVILAIYLDRVTSALNARAAAGPSHHTEEAEEKPVDVAENAAAVAASGGAETQARREKSANAPVNHTRRNLLIAGGGVAVLAAAGALNGGLDVFSTEKRRLRIAVMSGWDEGVAASWLWKQELQKRGYTVELTSVDAAAAYVGVSSGSYDLVLDTWLPETHADYIAQYGDRMLDLGSWYDEAKLTIAVNDDAPITSLSELAVHADDFDSRLIGIEPGAGLTRITTDAVIPDYGLQNLQYSASSTAAMLAELKSATDAGRNVVVTLWRPHWAYDAFPIRDLTDPKGALGSTENVHSFARQGLDSDEPDLVAWLKRFHMDAATLASLENAMFNSGVDGEDYSTAVSAWSEAPGVLCRSLLS